MTSPHVRFFEFRPNRWEGVCSAKEERDTNAEKLREARTCACVFEAAVLLLILTKHTKFNRQGPDIVCQCDVYDRGPRLAAEWLRGEALVCFTLNPLWKSLKEKSSTYPPALQRPAPNYPPTKLLKNNKNIWPGRTFDVATQCLTESRTALNREVCVNSPAPLNIWKRGSGKQMPSDWKQLLSWRNMGLNGAVCAKTSKNVTR